MLKLILVLFHLSLDIFHVPVDHLALQLGLPFFPAHLLNLSSEYLDGLDLILDDLLLLLDYGLDLRDLVLQLRLVRVQLLNQLVLVGHRPRHDRCLPLLLVLQHALHLQLVLVDVVQGRLVLLVILFRHFVAQFTQLLIQ